MAFLCFSCKSQIINKDFKLEEKEAVITNKKSNMYYIPDVSSEFERFDFEENKNKYTKEDLVLITDYGSVKGHLFILNINVNNKIVVKSFSKLENNEIKSINELTYYNNSPFFIRKEFYVNGNIKEKGLCIINGDFYKGTWYYYNEKGDLIHSINNDAFFKYSWENVVEFIKENDIVLSLGKPNGEVKFSSIKSTPTKLFPESSVKDSGQVVSIPLWTITWRNPGSSLNDYTEVILDGNTGRMIRRKKYTIAEGPNDKGTEEIENFELPQDKK